MSKANQEKPSGNKHSDIVKMNPDKIKGGNVGSHPPPKPSKPSKPEKGNK